MRGVQGEGGEKRVRQSGKGASIGVGVQGWARCSAADVLIARAEARDSAGHGAEALRRADARGQAADSGTAPE